MFCKKILLDTKHKTFNKLADVIDIVIVYIIEMYSGGNKMAMRIKIWWLTGWKFAI